MDTRWCNTCCKERDLDNFETDKTGRVYKACRLCTDRRRVTRQKRREKDAAFLARWRRARQDVKEALENAAAGKTAKAVKDARPVTSNANGSGSK